MPIVTIEIQLKLRQRTYHYAIISQKQKKYMNIMKEQVTLVTVRHLICRGDYNESSRYKIHKNMYILLNILVL